MKRPRQSEDESVLHEINKASDAIRKIYKLLQERRHATDKALNDIVETRRDTVEEVGGSRKSAE